MTSAASLESCIKSRIPRPETRSLPVAFKLCSRPSPSDSTSTGGWITEPGLFSFMFSRGQVSFPVEGVDGGSVSMLTIRIG
jgi:hypothetical protein